MDKAICGSWEELPCENIYNVLLKVLAIKWYSQDVSLCGAIECSGNRLGRNRGWCLQLLMTCRVLIFMMRMIVNAIRIIPVTTKISNRISGLSDMCHIPATSPIEPVSSRTTRETKSSAESKARQPRQWPGTLAQSPQGGLLPWAVIDTLP